MPWRKTLSQADVLAAMKKPIILANHTWRGSGITYAWLELSYVPADSVFIVKTSEDDEPFMAITVDKAVKIYNEILERIVKDRVN